jgi:SAM-dependent methyltransferase
MAFKNALASHEHSRRILDLLYEYDSFLDSLRVVADFGCGRGLDLEWWANLTTRDVPPEPRNYLVYGIDQDISTVEPHVKALPNVKLFQADFEKDIVIPRACDLLWAHDSFHYSLNPLQTLKLWNQQINPDGMLVLSIPQNTFNEYNRQQINSYSGIYYNYTLVNLIYMLAVSGFDCRDAYFYKESNDPWLYAAVYKSSDPLDAKTTNWYTLAEQNLVNDSVIASLNTHNYVKQEDLVVTWLDKDIYRVKE